MPPTGGDMKGRNAARIIGKLKVDRRIQIASTLLHIGEEMLVRSITMKSFPHSIERCLGFNNLKV